MSAADQSRNRQREQIVDFGKSLFERGLTAGSSGNLSVRLDDGWLLTPTNASLGRLDPAQLSKLDWDGKLISGDAAVKGGVPAPRHVRGAAAAPAPSCICTRRIRRPCRACAA